VFDSDVDQHLRIFPQVYEYHNLLNHKTIMAHAIYVSDEELDLFKKCRGASHKRKTMISPKLTFRCFHYTNHF
jgi:hypothetical protein